MKMEQGAVSCEEGAESENADGPRSWKCSSQTHYLCMYLSILRIHHAAKIDGYVSR